MFASWQTCHRRSFILPMLNVAISLLLVVQFILIVVLLCLQIYKWILDLDSISDRSKIRSKTYFA
jgi:hypothetical protein